MFKTKRIFNYVIVAIMIVLSFSVIACSIFLDNNVYAEEAKEENSIAPFNVEKVDSSYKITANKNVKFLNDTIYVDVQDIINKLLNVDITENQAIGFYNKLLQSNYALLNVETYYDNETSIESYGVGDVDQGWESDNGYITMFTSVFVSDYSGKTKKAEISTITMWMKEYIAGRDDYMVYGWSNNAIYLPGSAYGLVAISYHNGDNYFDNETNCKYNADNNCIKFTADVSKNTDVSWNYTGIRTDLTLTFDSTFTFKPHYYHDQGVFPYNDFISSISVSAGGVISCNLSGFLCKMKEYTPSEPIRIEY